MVFNSKKNTRQEGPVYASYGVTEQLFWHPGYWKDGGKSSTSTISICKVVLISKPDSSFAWNERISIFMQKTDNVIKSTVTSFL